MNPATPASQLLDNFQIYAMHDGNWGINQFNPDLTAQERLRSYNALLEAAALLQDSINLIRRNEQLVLASVAEAKAFFAVWPQIQLRAEDKKTTCMRAKK
ncbi:hypothetical protein BT93_A1619 [Corymbia citriodora subsp. variegata]|nr:hypothetical protein BT93_A1619 [Corymbia citriodora subsp. variegata]